jgi:hypothetical protein
VIKKMLTHTGIEPQPPHKAAMTLLSSEASRSKRVRIGRPDAGALARSEDCF